MLCFNFVADGSRRYNQKTKDGEKGGNWSDYSRRSSSDCVPFYLLRYEGDP